jgi:hypothetical protein
LLDALYRCLQQSSQVASAAVVVNAKDESANRFYEHFEFVSCLAFRIAYFFQCRQLAICFGMSKQQKRYSQIAFSLCGSAARFTSGCFPSCV